MTTEKNTRKNLTVEKLKVDVQPAESDQPEKVYITGYANTKNHADAYGDVPTNFNGQPVYDVSRFLQNPVLLINHENAVESIAGRFVELEEDQIGLKFKALLMSNAKTEEVQHAIEAYKQGFGVALSIGGQWFFEDTEQPKHLTKAIIHEISLVAVGADPLALTQGERAKTIPDGTNPKGKELLESIKAYRANPNVGNLLSVEENLK